MNKNTIFGHIHKLLNLLNKKQNGKNTCDIKTLYHSTRIDW